MNFRPVVAVSLSFGLGIFLRYAFSSYAFPIGAAAMLLFGGIACLCFRKNKKRTLRAAIVSTVLFIVFCAGCGSFALRIADFEKDKIEDGSYTVSATVKDISGGSKLILSDAMLSDGESVWALHGNIRVYVYSLPDEIGVGATVSFTAEIKGYDAFSYGKFNANLVLENTKYYASVSANKIEVSGQNGFHLFYAARERLRSVLFENMRGEEASLSYAMLTGDDDFIESGLLQNFRYGGVAHIFAVSGLHIGIIYGALTFLLKKCRMHWLIRSFVIFAVLFVFVGICGFSPSSVRAFVMCAVLAFASGAGFKYDKLNSVALAAFAVMLVDPVYLFSVGFQLSVAAAGGIILLSGTFARVLAKIKFPRKAASAVGVCLSAQISSFPLLLDYFGYVSASGLFTNLVFIPVIGIVYAVLFFLSVAAFILPFAAGVLLYLPELLLDAAVFPFTALEMKAFLIGGFAFGGFAALWYVIVILLSDKINLRLLPKSILCILLCAVLAFGTAAENGAFSGGNSVYVCGNYSCSLAYIRAGGDYVISYGKTDKDYLNSFALRYRLKEIDGLIVLGDEKDINESIPVFQSELPASAVYVAEPGDYLETFHSLLVVTPSQEFRFGEAMLRFCDAYTVVMSLDGAKYLLAGGDEAPADSVSADVLICPRSIPGLSELVGAKLEICFEKSEGKISVYRYGDLQIGMKNGIISVIH